MEQSYSNSCFNALLVLTRDGEMGDMYPPIQQKSREDKISMCTV
jgi:hypothetical protein